MKRAEKIRIVDLEARVAGSEVRARKNLGDDGITVILKGESRGLGEKGRIHLEGKRSKMEKRVRVKKKFFFFLQFSCI